MTYGLRAINKKMPNILTPMNILATDEAVASQYDLYLEDQLVRDEYGNVEKYYRLHSGTPHGIDMALAYDIKCPKCHSTLKQVGRCLDFHTLGLYECKSCKRK